MPKIALFIKTRVIPGKRDAVKRLWESHLKGRVEKSNAQKVYFFCYDRDDENIVCLFEYYDDSSVMDKNAESAWFAKYMEQVGPLLDGWPEVTTMDPMWVKSAEL